MNMYCIECAVCFVELNCSFCNSRLNVSTLKLTYMDRSTVVPTKSDSDVVLCLQLLRKNINLYTPPELTRINRLLVYQSYPVDRINTHVTYRFYIPDNLANKTRGHCHSWLAGQYFEIILCPITQIIFELNSNAIFSEKLGI